MSEQGVSAAAIAAAHARVPYLLRRSGQPEHVVRQVLDAAHDPLLGPDRLIRLGDVLDFMRDRESDCDAHHGENLSDLVEHEFTTHAAMVDHDERRAA